MFWSCLQNQNIIIHIEDDFIDNKKKNKSNDKFKLQNKLNILNEEYKMLISQKIKELSSCNNTIQREIIENTYKNRI